MERRKHEMKKTPWSHFQNHMSALANAKSLLTGYVHGCLAEARENGNKFVLRFNAQPVSLLVTARQAKRGR
eukprot:scaffold7991_cov19-Tisochrysis_lutea.AAC.1